MATIYVMCFDLSHSFPIKCKRLYFIVFHALSTRFEKYQNMKEWVGTYWGVLPTH